MKSKIIEIKRGNVVVKIYVVARNKHGRTYTEYKIADKSSGTRRLQTFGDEGEARQRAAAIAEATANGQAGSINSLPSDWEDVLEGLENRNLPVRPRRAFEIFRNACEMVEPEEIVAACRYWRDNWPNAQFTAKRVDRAVDEYLARQQHLSARRQDTHYTA